MRGAVEVKTDPVLFGLVAREVCEGFVAAVAGFVDVVRAEAFADAAFGEVAHVQRVVQPPGSVVIPQMVVRILSVYSY